MAPFISETQLFELTYHLPVVDEDGCRIARQQGAGLNTDWLIGTMGPHAWLYHGLIGTGVEMEYDEFGE